MTRYEDLIARFKTKWGDKFDSSDLAPHLVPYFDLNLRIRVRIGDEIITGRVGVTTGWRPVFLLMRNSRALGSTITLSSNVEVLAVQFGNNASPYIPIVKVDDRRLQSV